ncbi:MAG: hypothetical protein JSV22_12970 [Bacteroidales bacterium]|nr:MAG: hypothetical protein JSV22_12970 [Bacteroidales bacterium]
MNYFKTALRLGILILLLLGKSAYPQFVIVNSEKVLYENDSVILIINEGIRGDVQWEVSKDKENWITVPGGNSGTLHIRVDSSVYYRAKITEGTCNAIYSDTVLIAELYDERDNHIYDIVKIGYQWWMAENLDYYSSYGSWYYDDDSVSNSSYGRLYDWPVAQDICPSGWRLPEDNDWKSLELTLGMEINELENTGWRGTDQGDQLKTGGSSGFNLIFGGFRSESGIYELLDATATFWSGSQYDNDYAWFRGVSDTTAINRDIYNKQMAFSVRCIKNTVPSTATVGIHSITRISVRVEGIVLSDGGAPVTERGFCWNTSPNPVVQDNYKVAGGSTGEFSGFISGLVPNTTYYLRTYATNSLGTSYGNEVSFTTPQYSEPTLSTAPLSDISQTSVVTGGTVFDDGGNSIIDKGICWSISPAPGLSDNIQSEGAGFGSYVSNITGLTTNTSYYVRAYAYNSEDTAFGNEIYFTTLPVNEIDTFTDSRDEQRYKMVKIGNQWWMAENLNFSASGGSWYYNDDVSNSQYGRLYNWETAQTVCPAEWHLPSDEEWKTLEMEIGMSQAQADAIGLRGTDQGTQLKIGEPSGFDIIYSGFRDPSGVYSSLGSGATFWTSTEGGADMAWYRGFATDPQIHRDVFDKDYGFSVRCVREMLPIINTIPVDSIGKTYARSGGAIQYDGGLPVTAYGVCWSTSPNPTVEDNHTVDGSGTATFISTITGLVTNTTYYLRAYATNSFGTSYGEQEIFLTLTFPVISTTTPTSITVSSAHSGGTITDNGGSPVTARGVCWSTSPDPVVSVGNYTSDGTGTGSYTSIITGLQINTTYYLRAYATNSKGTGYGDQKIFETLPTNETGTVTDSRDGKTYETVKIGYQWWMAENLDYDRSGSWCYDDISANCDTMGKLYSWNAAQNACPADWHLPSDDEWKILEIVLGMSQADADDVGLRGTDQGTQLKKGGSTGFDILYSGFRDPGGTFTSYGSGATFWTSTEETSGTAWYRGFATDPQIHRETFDKDYGFSVRCVLDILPNVTTDIVDSIGKTYARCGGNVTFDGGLQVIERGVCWSTSQNPDIGDSHTSDGAGLGEFTSIITGLIPNRTYYVRAYATSSVGTAYGDEVSFVSVTLPQLTTTQVSSIGETDAYSGGNITDNGGTAIIARGVCWSINPNPTTFDDQTSNGSGSGIFISHITGLNANTVYYVRAYAINSKGTAYGQQIVFETLPYNETGSFTDSRNGKIYETVKIGDQWWMAENLNYIMVNSWCYNNNPSYCDSLGRLYSWNAAESSCPSGWRLPEDQDVKTLEIELGMSAAEADNTGLRGTDQGTQLKKGGSSGFDMLYSGYRSEGGSYFTLGTGATFWTSTESGSSAWYRGFGTHSQVHRDLFDKDYGFSVRCLKIELPVVTTETITSITENSATGGGEVTSDGGATVTARGVCWSTSQNPDIGDDHTSDGSGLGSFVSTITGLDPNTQYYVRAYATNSEGTGYGDEVSFYTQAGLPELTTAVVTSITENSAESGGTITSDGGAPITARGVCWSTSQNPDTGDDHTTDGTGTGTFVSAITGLDPNTTYYVRAYATNSEGTSYGNQRSFITVTGLPVVTTASIGSVTDISASSGGNVTYDGGATITARGVCWSTSQNPDINDDYTTDGTGLGTFVSSITGLTPGTQYYVRAYATNSSGTAYGNQESFTTTSTLATVTTASISSITENSASGGGNVTDGGGSPVTARGVCWSTSANPTIADNTTTDGSGTGAFVSALSGLTAGTEYFVRAYAINSAGTAYGNEVSFTTLNETGTLVDVRDSQVYNTVKIGDQWWMAENLNFYTDSGSWYYDDDSVTYAETYGRLYSWDTVMAGAASSNTVPSGVQGVCPSGWHIPSDAEWAIMTDELGGLTVAGGKMKEEGFANWTTPNTGATNISGFTALPAGERTDASVFQYEGDRATYWSTTEQTGTDAWTRILNYDSNAAVRDRFDKDYGFSVRCVQD